MRYVVRVLRAQVAERTVRAADEEAAIQRVREELDKPYGFLGRWTTTSIEVEAIEASHSLPTP